MVDNLEPHIIEQLVKAKILELQRLEQEIKDQLDADGGATHNIKVCNIFIADMKTIFKGSQQTEQIYSSLNLQFAIGEWIRHDIFAVTADSKFLFTDEAIEVT